MRGNLKTRRWPVRLLGAAAAVVSLLAASAFAFHSGWLGNPWGGFERDTLNPGLRSAATPGDLGVPYERVLIHSGPRRLEGFYVPAAQGCGAPAAVLIFHGRNETIAEWGEAQRRFRQECIASLAFDYSGHGRSDGPGTIANLDEDAMAAYQALLALAPAGRRCLFSHSMGGGPLLRAATAPGAAPDCIVLASPFSSLRSMAERGGLPRLLGALMPEAWDNAARVPQVRAPLMWIHSRSDETIPIEEGRTVFDRAPEPRFAVITEGHRHNAVYQDFPADIWDPMTAFIRGE